MSINEPEAEMADVDDDSFARIVTDPDRRRREWVNENYDVLVELFHNFRDQGTQIFGMAFYQLGGFHTFTWHVYDMTHKF